MNWQFRLGILLSIVSTGSNLRAQTTGQQADTNIYQTEAFTTATPDSPATAVVQTPIIPPRIIRPRKPKPIAKELSGGIKMNSDGWGLFAEKGWVRSDEPQHSDRFYNIRLVSVELSEHKHQKEKREPNTNRNFYGNDKPKPFIYGKTNNFYALKLGYGHRKMIAGKPDPGTVSIHWVYTGGLSVGLLKPYYIDAYVAQDNPGTLVKKSIKYSEDTKEAFLKQQYIIGSAGWSKGLNELKFIPGIHAKTGLHFDFAPTAKSKMALEVGVSAELYTQKIELMANQDAYPYLVNAYVAFQFGKRY